MDTFDWVTFPNIGLGTIVVLVIFSIIKGWLIPKNSVDARMADKNAELEHVIDERNIWRTTAQTKDVTINTLAAQLSESLESAKISTAITEALHKVVSNGQS